MRTSLFAPKWHLISRVLLHVYRFQQELGDPPLLPLLLAVILVSLALACMALAG
jgi:hypothetical protein